METEIASLLGKNGKMPVSGIVEHLKGGKFPKATQKGVKTILQSNGETFTPEGDQWTLSKSKEGSKKRRGDSESLPSGTKKSKSTESGSNTSKASSSTSSSAKDTSKTSSMDTSADSSTAKNSVFSVPTGFAAPAFSGLVVTNGPAQKSNVFGFAAPKPGQAPPARKAVEVKRVAKEEAQVPEKPVLPKPTIESDLPARYVAEGMSVEHALSKVISKHASSSSTADPERPLIVIDTANVNYEHGKGEWSTHGLSIAVKYYQSKNFEVVAFLPEHYLTQHYPDPLQDWTPLETLAKKKILIPTPAADYDDLYIVQHARNHNGIIVSNDRFKDVPTCFNDPAERTAIANWIKSHKIAFLFDGDEFKPRLEVEELLRRQKKKVEKK